MKINKENSFLELKDETEGKTLSIFCFDTVSTEEAILNIVEQIFYEELLPTLIEYGEVLKKIHNRLLSEGYIFLNGKFSKQNGNIK